MGCSIAFYDCEMIDTVAQEMIDTAVREL